MPSATTRVTGDGGVELAVHHLGGDGPPVLLVHATGFHGRCWTPLARTLAPAYSVWAVDQRGHGASGKSPDGRYDDWEVFARDLLAVIDALGTETGTGGEPWLAGGHSLGGGVALLAEARRPGTFRALACYEPVVIPPGGWDEGGPAVDGPPPARRNPLAELARKRRPTFDSREAAYDNYRSKPPFAAFDDEALRCYVEYGLVDQPDGTVTLACRREDEAAVFEGAAANPAWGVLPQVRPPVAVMAGGDLSDPVTKAAPHIAKRLARGGLVTFAGLDHFGPMTGPAAVGEAMARAFAEGGRPSGGGRSAITVTPPG